MGLREQQRNKVNSDAVMIDITTGENDNSVRWSKIIVGAAGIRLYESDMTHLFSRCLINSIIDIGQACINQ